jgi:predicted SAM-dependent methyltransferase
VNSSAKGEKIMRELLKQFLPLGLVNIIKKAREESRRRQIELSRHKKIKTYLESHRIRKLQLGSGDNILEGWLNTDLTPRSKKEIVFLDVRELFLFDDCTFDYIFCEHLIEHLEYQEGVDMLSQCFRILKQGGKIRIATPDLCFLIELYNSEKTELQERYISWAVDTFLSDIAIYQDVFVMNNFFRDWGHKFIYDFKSLHTTMSRVGFINITGYNIGESDDNNFRGVESHGRAMPDEFNKLETFVLEGSKPA